MVARSSEIRRLVKRTVVRIRQREGDPVERYAGLMKFLQDDSSNRINALSSRWMVSVLDTIADYGSPLERANAMIVSTFINTTRMMWTASLPIEDAATPEWQELYDEVTSIGCSPLADTPYNLFRRINNSLLATPIIHKIFHLLVCRIQKADHHPLVKLDKMHGNLFKRAFNMEYVPSPIESDTGEDPPLSEIV